MYYPSLDLTKDIQNWVVYKIGVPPNEHCYPDYIPGEHDWRDEFDLGLIIDVVNNGKTFN